MSSSQSRPNATTTPPQQSQPLSNGGSSNGSGGGGGPPALRPPPTSPPQQQQQQQQQHQPPPPFAIVRLAAAIRSNIDRIAAAERIATGQADAATRHQCDLAVRFIAHYAAHKAGEHILEQATYVASADALAAGRSEVYRLDGGRERSLFELFTEVAVHLRVGHAVAVRLDRARAYLKEASILGDCCGISVSIDDDAELTATANRATNDQQRCHFSGGATQIIFDSGDAAAAFAELDTAHTDCTAPWRIRLCWVHESLRSHFEATFEEVSSAPGTNSTGEEAPTDVGGQAFVALARPLGGRVRRTASGGVLIVDMPLALWQPAQLNRAPDSDQCVQQQQQQVVLVQFFRTCKDVVRLLLAQQPAHSVQSLSVWTENVSVTLELAHALPAARNIWQNCVGLLDPHVPFTFREDASAGAGNRIYGSELALCQTVIRRAATAAAQPLLDAKRLGVHFAAELSAEAGDYSAMRHLERIAFMTSARRRAAADEAVAAWVVEARDVLKRRLITNVVFNEFQTIVVPYGTIFAN